MSASFSSHPKDTNDLNKTWQAWFRGPSYQNIFDGLPLSNNHMLQNSTVFLMSLLRRQSCATDRYSLTLERCHVVLRQVADPSTLSKDETLEARAQCAFTILEAMEYHFNTRTKSALFDSPSPRASRYTYNLVLLLCAKSMQIELALKTLQRMNDTFEQGYLDMRPDINTWNQLIDAVADSDHWDKAYHASIVLYHMMGKMRHKNGKFAYSKGTQIDEKGSTVFEVAPDLSTFGYVFRACATIDSNNQNACRLTGQIALKIWKDLQQSDLFQYDEKLMTRSKEEWTEHESCLFLYAIESISFLQDHSLRNETLCAIVESCCHFGLVTPRILSSIRSATSKDTWFYILDCILKTARKEEDLKQTGDHGRLWSKIPFTYKRNVSED